MPKRADVSKVLIIGSGPIVIGQACEFDYSGTQACKALRQLGYEVVLVNSNPATIMTDPETAEATYIEPLNVERIAQIIEKERPDALLPNLGGQSGLNLSSELAATGVLDTYGVQVIGTPIDAIERGEDRDIFKQTVAELDIEMARSKVAHTVEEAVEIANELGYPCVLRPAYTMGGTGGGLVYNIDELHDVVARGLAASPVSEVLVEESVLGWEELEFEVVRDASGHMITVCTIENIDPMGVHTGDSFCVAPMQTIAPETIDRLERKSWQIVDAVKVIGGTNVQWAHDPATDRDIIIEINPRTSRSSALASKATGFPIALVSALLACGLTLDEIPCGRHGTLANYRADGDYVVVKFARWAFEKFPGVEDKLGTQMRAVGEVMAIGKTYKEAFQKAIRSLEQGRYGLGVEALQALSKAELMGMLAVPTSERQFVMYAALGAGATVEELCAATHIKREFVQQMAELVAEEALLRKWANDHPNTLPSADILVQAKCDGFADRYLADLFAVSEAEVRTGREAAGAVQHWEGVHVCSTQDRAYYYSTYHESSDASAQPSRADSANPARERRKVMILGGGPNRIGQGIEFDYCCVHAAKALANLGFETVMVNCNPETVSTDYDTSDTLYFEPLCVEDVLSIYQHEQPLGIIAQFGGQTPLNLAAELQQAGANILGTPPDVIDLAEDRDRFRAVAEKLGIPMPEAGMASTIDQAVSVAESIGYPVMVRPSYVLGGRGMEIVYDDAGMHAYMEAAEGVTAERPVLIDRFLNNALECEADAVCDGQHAYVPAVMEHVELAGVHSGDSAAILPSVNIPPEQLGTIRAYTRNLAEAMHVQGMMNVQYAIEGDTVFLLEANPRASRTVPLVSKVCGVQMVQLATEVIMLEHTKATSPVPALAGADASADTDSPRYFGVKEAVFPFNMFPEVDPVLGPEMRSTGEVLGLARNFGEAFAKAQEACGTPLPQRGVVLMSLADTDKAGLVRMGRLFVEAGFEIVATHGTRNTLVEAGVPATLTLKASEGRPNLIDLITNGGVDLVVNSPSPTGKSAADGALIRRAAIRAHIPIMTTAAAGKAAAIGIRALQATDAASVHSLQSLQTSA